ncbi:transposase [Micromonospora sp. U56]|nr:transposase [Micromonospora sp. U56]
MGPPVQFVADLRRGSRRRVGEPQRQLAGFAGLAPAPWDSGRIHGNLHRPRRYHRGLQRVFYYSAQISIATCPESRRFYDRKRAEDKRHIRAVLALARRRVMSWAKSQDQHRFLACRRSGTEDRNTACV